MENNNDLPLSEDDAASNSQKGAASTKSVEATSGQPSAKGISDGKRGGHPKGKATKKKVRMGDVSKSSRRNTHSCKLTVGTDSAELAAARALAGNRFAIIPSNKTSAEVHPHGMSATLRQVAIALAFWYVYEMLPGVLRIPAGEIKLRDIQGKSRPVNLRLIRKDEPSGFWEVPYPHVCRSVRTTEDLYSEVNHDWTECRDGPFTVSMSVDVVKNLRPAEIAELVSTSTRGVHIAIFHLYDTDGYHNGSEHKVVKRFAPNNEFVSLYEDEVTISGQASMVPRVEHDMFWLRIGNQMRIGNQVLVWKEIARYGSICVVDFRVTPCKFPLRPSNFPADLSTVKHGILSNQYGLPSLPTRFFYVHDTGSQGPAVVWRDCELFDKKTRVNSYSAFTTAVSKAAFWEVSDNLERKIGQNLELKAGEVDKAALIRYVVDCKVRSESVINAMLDKVDQAPAGARVLQPISNFLGKEAGPVTATERVEEFNLTRSAEGNFWSLLGLRFQRFTDPRRMIDTAFYFILTLVVVYMLGAIPGAKAQMVTNSTLVTPPVATVIKDSFLWLRSWLYHGWQLFRSLLSSSSGLAEDFRADYIEHWKEFSDSPTTIYNLLKSIFGLRGLGIFTPYQSFVIWHVIVLVLLYNLVRFVWPSVIFAVKYFYAALRLFMTFVGRYALIPFNALFSLVKWVWIAVSTLPPSIRGVLAAVVLLLLWNAAVTTAYAQPVPPSFENFIDQINDARLEDPSFNDFKYEGPIDQTKRLFAFHYEYDETPEQRNGTFVSGDAVRVTREGLVANGIVFSNFVPFVPSTSAYDERVAILGRVNAVVPEPDHSLWLLAFAFLVIAVPACTIVPAPYGEWNRRFPSGRRKSHDRALKEMKQRGLSLKDVWRQAFVKFEKLMKFCIPRNISGTTHYANVIIGPWMYSFSKYLQRIWNLDNAHRGLFYASGVTPVEVGHWMNIVHAITLPWHLMSAVLGDDNVSCVIVTCWEVVNGVRCVVTYRIFFQFDGSKFDMTLCSFALACERAIYRMMAAPLIVLWILLHQVVAVGYTMMGLLFGKNGGRNSGDSNTSPGNTMLNGGIIQTAFSEWFRLHFGLSVEEMKQYWMPGDRPGNPKRDLISDLLIDDLLDNLETFMVDYLTRAGLRPKFKVTRDPLDIEFLSGHFYETPEGWIWYPKIGRTLSKIGWTLSKQDLFSRERDFRATCLAYYMSYRDLPILGDYFHRVLEHYGDITQDGEVVSTVAPKDFHHMKHGCGRIVMDGKEKSRFIAYLSRFGVTSADVREFRSSLRRAKFVPYCLDSDLVGRLAASAY